jgi:hypothetical protein
VLLATGVNGHQLHKLQVAGGTSIGYQKPHGHGLRLAVAGAAHQLVGDILAGLGLRRQRSSWGRYWWAGFALALA